MMKCDGLWFHGGGKTSFLETSKALPQYHSSPYYTLILDVCETLFGPFPGDWENKCFVMFCVMIAFMNEK